MSMNVYAKFIDSKGRCVHSLNLQQTPTQDSYRIVFGCVHPWEDQEDADWYDNNRLDNETILNNYLEWMHQKCAGREEWNRENYLAIHRLYGTPIPESDTTDEEIFEEDKQRLLDEIALFSDDYELVWYVA